MDILLSNIGQFFLRLETGMKNRIELWHYRSLWRESSEFRFVVANHKINPHGMRNKGKGSGSSLDLKKIMQSPEPPPIFLWQLAK